MAEQYRNPQYDPRMSPHRFLLQALAARTSAKNELVRVAWGKFPTLFIGGMVEMRTAQGSNAKYEVAVSTEPWRNPAHAATRDEVMYDIHLFGEQGGRRYGVCAGTTFLAETMGRLTTQKLITEVDKDTTRNLLNLVRHTQFSKAATDSAQAALGSWDVIEPASQLDYTHPDNLGVYYYMDVLHQEQQGQQE